jgi:putative ATPase
MVILASEDIGMADPMSLLIADAAARAVEFVGLPEAQLNLAQAVIHLATAPKSNAALTAISRARQDVQSGRGRQVPIHLRDGHYRGAQTLGHGVGYVYPHRSSDGAVDQQYLPEDLLDARYYEPSGNGLERDIAERRKDHREDLDATEENNSEESEI